MSALSFVELENFYNETIDVLEELQRRKLLKKLPDDIQSKVTDILHKYVAKSPEIEKPGPLTFDSRLHTDCEVPVLTANDVDEFWWKGNVEVKGVSKSPKFTKCYCVCSGSRVAFFAGPKKKPMKGQLVLSPAAILEVLPDGKKMGNIVSIKEMTYNTVILKFSSVEDGTGWLDSFNKSKVPLDKDPLSLDKEDEAQMLYEVMEDVQTEYEIPNVFCPRGDEKSLSSVSKGSNDPALDSTNMTPATAASLDSTNMTPATAASLESAESNSIISEDTIEEEPPTIWGEYSYTDVYQAEWSFNKDGSVLDGKSLLSLGRGQLVLLKESVNTDWWKGVDTKGNEGYIASCFLSLAYEL